MTRSRIALFSVGLFLLGIAGAGIYLYPKLPELLRLQVERNLRHYGVAQIEYEGLHFSHTDARVDTLRLRGTYVNLAYQASFTDGALRYDWRALLAGKVNSLSLTSVDISVVQTAASNSQTPAIIAVENFLPRHLSAQLPVQSLRIEHWQASYPTPGNRAMQAHGSLVIDQHIDLQLQTQLASCAATASLRADRNTPDLLLEASMIGDQIDDQRSVASLTAELTGSVDNGWQWQVQGQAEHAPLLSCVRDIVSQHGLAAGVPAAGIPAVADFALDGASTFTARIYHPDTLNLAASPEAVDAPLRQVQASIRLNNEIRRLDIPTLVENLAGTLALDVTLADARINAVLQPFTLEGTLATPRLSLPDSWQHRIGWEDTVPIHLETAEPVTITAAGSSDWSVQSPNTLLSLGDKETQLRFEKLDLAVDTRGSDPVQASVRLDTTLTTRLNKKALPQLQAAFTHTGTFEHSDITLHIADTTESFRADLTGALNPTSGSGDYLLNAHIDDLPYFTEMAVPLLQHFAVLDDSVAMRSGTITLATALNSKGFEVENWTQQSQLWARNVSGNINDNAFEKLELTADWSGTTRWKTRQPLAISIASLDLGVVLQDIQFQMSLPKSTPITQPQLRIETFSANIFGGKLIMPDMQDWDFAATSNSTTLVARGWQLGEIVTLQKNADIQAEGTLEGELPITIAERRVIIDTGYLRALPGGGSIRYRATDSIRAMADNNSELALALDLLSDFQYQLLNSEVQLDKAGNLLLALSLAGSNPALYDGQAVRFNINVEQNLYPLLQSLRIGDNLEQQIEGGLK
jgi:hypothetical protein